MDNVLAIDLTKILHRPGSNLVLSPFSVHSALCLVLPGSDETSRAELMKILFNIQTEDAAKSKDLIENFCQKLRKFLRDNENVLKNANFLYTSNRFPVKPEFVQTLTNQFMSIAKELNFADTATSLNVINNDVKKATKGLIPSLLNSIDPMTRLILVNAIYFKGLWKYPFPKGSVHDEEFILGDGKKIKTKMMFIKKKFPQYRCQNLKVHALKLEYSSGTVSMIILLPDPESNVQNLLAKLNNESLKPIFGGLVYGGVEVELTLPKFKMESTHELSTHLNRLGLNSVFDNRACFPGISKEPLHISEVIQKAVIEVNEEGTEAAAATAIMMMRCCAMPMQNVVFKVNRPFVFLLMSNDGQNVLFTGVVENPLNNK